MDEENNGDEMVPLLKKGLTVFFNTSLERLDIEDSEFDMKTCTRCERDPSLLPPLHRGAWLGRGEVYSFRELITSITATRLWIMPSWEVKCRL